MGFILQQHLPLPKAEIVKQMHSALGAEAMLMNQQVSKRPFLGDVQVYVNEVNASIAENFIKDQ